jgi:hypothetical protein
MKLNCQNPNDKASQNSKVTVAGGFCDYAAVARVAAKRRARLVCSQVLRKLTCGI